MEALSRCAAEVFFSLSFPFPFHPSLGVSLTRCSLFSFDLVFFFFLLWIRGLLRLSLTNWHVDDSPCIQQVHILLMW